LLTERIAFSRDPAEDPVGRSQLLHQHVEMAIEGAHGGMVIRARHRDCGRLLLALRALQGPRAAAGVLARHVAGKRLGDDRGTLWSLDHLARRLGLVNG